MLWTQCFFFVKYFFSQIEKKYCINKIYLSGWRKPINDVEGRVLLFTGYFSSFKKYKLVLVNKKRNNNLKKNCLIIQYLKNLIPQKKAVFFTDLRI